MNKPDITGIAPFFIVKNVPTTSFLPAPRAFMRRWAKEVAGALPT